MRASWRAWAPLVAVAALIIALGVVQGSGGRPALDPNGTGRTGAKALVLLLRRYGAGVDLTADAPSATTKVALLLTDHLDDARRTAVSAWVARGGRLVVADPLSPLQVGAATPGGSSRPLDTCDLPGLGLISRLDVGTSYFLRLPGGGRASGCFGDGGTQDAAYFLVAVPEGRGTVVGLGGAGLWANQRLDHDDNAALAVALLAPTPTTDVAVLLPSRAGSGDRSAYTLLSPRIRSTLYQLLVAFGVFAWWRGRRLGRPVPEALPVDLAGSEIVAAVGNLLHRTRSRDAAASQLRRGARRMVAGRVGLAPSAPPDVIADALSARGGVDRARAAQLLDDAPVADEEALVRLAQSLAHLREEVTHGTR